MNNIERGFLRKWDPMDLSVPDQNDSGGGTPQCCSTAADSPVMKRSSYGNDPDGKRAKQSAYTTTPWLDEQGCGHYLFETDFQLFDGSVSASQLGAVLGETGAAVFNTTQRCDWVNSAVTFHQLYWSMSCARDTYLLPWEDMWETPMTCAIKINSYLARQAPVGYGALVDYEVLDYWTDNQVLKLVCMLLATHSKRIAPFSIKVPLGQTDQ